MPGLAPVDIGSPAFSTENPSTWGFAPPARRVFGLAAHDGRLYYSVAQGPQIWSVGINQDGSLTDARLEVDVPVLQDGIEVASITFDGQGRMYLAERGPTTGDYGLTQLAIGGSSRVLRFLPSAPGGDSPGPWQLEAQQYAIGMPPAFNNADGGVALGFGYLQTGAVNFGACGATVWSTGERLLDPGDPSADPSSFPAVDGLQGNALPLVEPQNMPPTHSWFVDYDDAAGQPRRARLHGRDRQPQSLRRASAAATTSRIRHPTAASAAAGLTCPPGTVFQGGSA